MRPGGVSPVPALWDATERSTNRGNALGRGESSPQPEMGTARLQMPMFSHRLIYWYLSRSHILELALVALAEIPEADAEGVFL